MWSYLLKSPTSKWQRIKLNWLLLISHSFKIFTDLVPISLFPFNKDAWYGHSDPQAMWLSMLLYSWNTFLFHIEFNTFVHEAFPGQSIRSCCSPCKLDSWPHTVFTVSWHLIIFGLLLLVVSWISYLPQNTENSLSERPCYVFLSPHGICFSIKHTAGIHSYY